MGTLKLLSKRDEVSTSRWYALHIRSNFETRVSLDLSARELETYLPAIEELHQWKDRKKKLSLPLFPGYVFVRFEDTPVARINVLKTNGVVRILGQGIGIEPVPDEQVEAVRELLRSKSRCSAHPFLKEGDWVRMKRGSLQGLEGFLIRFKNGSRLVISIPLLQQGVSVEIDARDAEPIHRKPYAQAS
jgi:transcription antitermination factor NusG